MAVPQASVPFTLLLGVLIARELGANADADLGGAQLAVTTYLLGLAVGQLAWGSVSDRYGRKPVLLAGVVHG